MKIKVKEIPYSEVKKIAPIKQRKPQKPSILFQSLVRLLSIPDLIKTHFSYTKEDMEKAGNGPWFILMNHSCFLDLKIAFKLLYPKPFNIVCTQDAFIGKDLLMRLIGCIPTKKFINDTGLIRTIRKTLKNKNTSVLMFPEAGYSFDGCATTIPKRLGSLLKLLDVPVVGIVTEGAFLYDPLYNSLQTRKVKVSAKMKCILSREEVREKSVEELDEIINYMFSFDAFREQKEKNVLINEPFRADGLHKVLYKCISCGGEGKTEGSGTTFFCKDCGKRYTLSPLGELVCDDEHRHIPDWYNWQRKEVEKELLDKSYLLDTAVDVFIMKDTKAIYKVGEGRLVHSVEGFHLTACNGELEYRQSPLSSYGLNADFFWYEIGDVICIGDEKEMYYCIPKKENVVTKTRLATEELYKIAKAQIQQ